MAIEINGKKKFFLLEMEKKLKNVTFLFLTFRP